MIFFDFVPQLKLFAKRIINPNTSSVFTELSESKQKKTRFWVIRAWIVMLHFVFSSLSRICNKKKKTTLPKIWSILSLSSLKKVHLEQLTIPIFMKTTFVARIRWTILIWSHFNLTFSFSFFFFFFIFLSFENNISKRCHNLTWLYIIFH